MSAAVDGELHEPKLSEFLEHIRVCEACRAEFEAEKATKALLQSRLKRVKAPKSLVEAIKRQTIGSSQVSQFAQMVRLLLITTYTRKLRCKVNEFAAIVLRL